jgi:hypothetical protein
MSTCANPRCDAFGLGHLGPCSYQRAENLESAGIPFTPIRDGLTSLPVQKLDADKLRLGLLPFAALEETAKVFGYGAGKYRPNGWRTVDNAVERYRDALLRHLFAHLRGEVLDPESGLRHLAHAATNALLLLELERSDV